VTYLEHLAAREFADVVVENYHKFARGYLQSRGKMGWNAIASPDERLAYINSAIANLACQNVTHPLFAQSSEFLADEIRWISQSGIQTFQVYVATSKSLPPALQGADTIQLLWRLLEEYRAERQKAGKSYDWDDVAVAVRDELARDVEPRVYRHVVIDEGQDFSPMMIQSLVGAVPTDGSVTFFGDVAQQIYGSRVTWRSAGLNLSGAPWLFQENYRNSKQIADLALALSRMPFYSGSADMVTPNSPKAAGPLPSLVTLASAKSEDQFVMKQAVQLSQAGSVAILTSDHETRRHFNSLFKRGTFSELTNEMTRWSSSAGLSIGTYHAAKGLEFDSVILPRMDAKWMPNPYNVTTFGDARASADAGRLIYVGITRARQGLILSCSGPSTTLLPADPKLMNRLSL
jgi:superfamily I DNA/RNA helicase